MPNIGHIPTFFAGNIDGKKRTNTLLLSQNIQTSTKP